MANRIKMKTIFIALMIFSMAAAGTASAAGIVSVVPQSQNAAPGAVFSVSVNIDSGSDNLQGAHVELNFDTNVLTATGYSKGTLLGTNVLEEPNIGISEGKVTYGAARTQNPTASPVNGTFITVQFQVKSSAQSGASGLNLVSVNLKNTTTGDLEIGQVNDGMVIVTGGSPSSSQTSAQQTSISSTGATSKPTTTAGNTTTAGEIKNTPVGTKSTTTPAYPKNTTSEPSSAPKTPGFSASMALIAVLNGLIICNLIRKKNRSAK
jgi:hypothetical protein